MKKIAIIGLCIFLVSGCHSRTPKVEVKDTNPYDPVRGYQITMAQLRVIEEYSKSQKLRLEDVLNLNVSEGILTVLVERKDKLSSRHPILFRVSQSGEILK
jgi:hypothetical protein